MTGTAVLFATALTSLVLCIEAGAEEGRRTLDLKVLDERDRRTVTAPSAEELRRAEDEIGFAADWALEADLRNRFSRGRHAWRELVVRHEEELERIREQNRRGEAILAWAQWFELAGQLMAFAGALDAAVASASPRTTDALELCDGDLCETLEVELLLERASPVGATDLESLQFDEVRGRLLQSLPSLGSLRCDMVVEQCWVPGESEAAASRIPAAQFALLGHMGRIAARMSHGALRGGRQALLAANRHWAQWRNIYEHWRKHGQKFPGNPTILRYAEEMNRFLKAPPPGTRMALRPNGDRMLYHAPSDRFGVIGQNGFLKTFFRPGRGVARDGLKYWRGQLRRWSATEEVVR